MSKLAKSLIVCIIAIALFFGLYGLHGSTQLNAAASNKHWRFGCQSSQANVDGPCSRGVVNGVKVEIPNMYLVSIFYKEQGSAKHVERPEQVDQDAEISDFGIALKLSTLEPIKTAEDRRNWIASRAVARPFFMTAWMMVDFNSHYPVNRSVTKDMPHMLEQDDAHWGPFVRDKSNRYGLVHYESVQSVDNSKGHGHVEYFYSENSLTNIECKTDRVLKPPFDTNSVCYHYFLISDLNLMAEAFYTKNDVGRWPDIESSVRKIAHSLIVK